MEGYGTLMGTVGVFVLGLEVLIFLHYSHRAMASVHAVLDVRRGVALACVFLATNLGLLVLETVARGKVPSVICLLGTDMGHPLALLTLVPWLALLVFLVWTTEAVVQTHASWLAQRLALLFGLFGGILTCVFAGCDHTKTGHVTLRVIVAFTYLLCGLLTTWGLVWTSLYAIFMQSQLAMTFAHWLGHMPLRMTALRMLQEHPWQTYYAVGYPMLFLVWGSFDPLFNTRGAVVALGYFLVVASLGNYVLYARTLPGKELDVIFKQHDIYYVDVDAEADADADGEATGGLASEKSEDI